MDDGRAPAPREQGWKKFVLALAAFLLVSRIPALAAAAPVEDTMLLLLPALAVCFLIGWWSGGRLALAIAWLGLAAWVLTLPATSGTAAYRDLARSWGLLSAAAFGVVCLASRDRAFLHRALSAVGIAVLVALLLLAISQGGAQHAQSIFAEQFAARNGQWAARMQLVTQQLAAQAPATSLRFGDWTAEYLQELNAYSALMVSFYPAMLALEALVALAIGWGLYHRLSRVRLGPPLAPLRDFRFNDQLIWGLVVGLTLVLLPSFAPVSAVGKNLLLFFGALYALRGLGVMAWMIRGSRPWMVAVLVVVGMLLSPLVLSVALGLGISDTWADWRTRLRSLTPPGHDGSPS